MRKIILAVLLIGLLAPASIVLAVSIDYTGRYQLLNEGGIDNFRETIRFTTAVRSGYSGIIESWDPTSDTIFGNYGLIKISDLKLDPTNYVKDDYFMFNPKTYTGGFEVYDFNENLLFKADLTVQKLVTDNSTGRINSILSTNLTNIQASTYYNSLLVKSPVVEGFLKPPIGAANITLNFAGNLSNAILGLTPNGAGGTYSGSAVPEPLTILLLGGGLLSAFGLKRRSRNMKSQG